MKIVFLISAMNTGGAQRVAATLLNSWASRGDEVMLMPTFSGRGDCFFALHPAVRLVYLADLVPGNGKSPLGLLQRFRALRNFLRREDPDYVVSFLTPVNVAAILASRGLNARVVVSERVNPLVELETHWWWRLLRRFIYPRSDVVLVQTTDILEEFSRRIPGLRSVVVMPNPLPSGMLEAKVYVNGGVTARKRLVAMGRLEHQKGFGLLIDAFHRVSQTFPQWDLYIWGEGSLRERLERRVRNLGLSGRVVLAGETEQPWRELAAADVFVLSSLYEGFPNVLIEAMALGVAAVSFDCPSGPLEITRGGTDALLVPTGDEKALSASLAKLMGDEGLRNRLGAIGAQSVRERYSVETVLTRWDEMFRQISSPAKRGGT